MQSVYVVKILTIDWLKFIILFKKNLDTKK